MNLQAFDEMYANNDWTWYIDVGVINSYAITNNALTYACSYPSVFDVM